VATSGALDEARHVRARGRTKLATELQADTIRDRPILVAASTSSRHRRVNIALGTGRTGAASLIIRRGAVVQKLAQGKVQSGGQQLGNAPGAPLLVEPDPGNEDLEPVLGEPEVLGVKDGPMDVVAPSGQPPTMSAKKAPLAYETSWATFSRMQTQGRLSSMERVAASNSWPLGPWKPSFKPAGENDWHGGPAT
jgi:hypothetical protein